MFFYFFFFFSSRRRHTRCSRDWSSDVCSSDLTPVVAYEEGPTAGMPPTAIGSTAAVSASTPPAGAVAGTEVDIKSPMIGTFYRAPSPESAPYVDVGSEVNPETVVCIIEAMKVMNEIKAEAKGVVTQILVENAKPVEFGQPLFKIRPTRFPRTGWKRTG